MSCKLFDIAAFWPESNVMLVEDRLTPRYYRDVQSMARSSRKELRHAVVLDAQNLSSAWVAWIERESHDWHRTLVRCLPPWKNVFIYGGVVSVRDSQPLKVGLHCQALAPGECAARGIDEPRSDVAVRLTIDTWYQRGRENRVRYDAPTCVIDFNEDGKYLLHGHRDVGVPANEMSAAATLAPFAFQLMHCRNIVVHETTEVAKVRRGHRNQAPKVKYHTLSISNTLVKREGQEPSGEHPGVAKHVVRGNFAHYTDENKLFGKFTGMFWRPMHIRGEAKHGIVGKEYELAGASS